MIYIIGGLGFVGSGFVRYCTASGLEYAVIEPETYDQYRGTACDLLINANGSSSKILATKDPARDLELNVASVQKTTTDFTYRRYVHISSCDVYADCSNPESTREDVPPDIALQHPYGFHKYLAEQCVRHASDNWLIFRMGGFIGPGMKKNAIFDIINGGPLWLDPASELQFLHTDEAARIVMTMAHGEISNEVFNLCGSGTVSLASAMGWANATVEVQPESPRVTYDVSIEKLSKHIEIPPSAKAVEQFILAETGAESTT